MKKIYTILSVFLIFTLLLAVNIGSASANENANPNSCKEPTACYQALCANGNEVIHCGPLIAFQNKVAAICGR